VNASNVFVADYDGGLRVIDASNPASVTEVGNYSIPGYSVGVTINGDYTYLADSEEVSG